MSETSLLRRLTGDELKAFNAPEAALGRLAALEQLRAGWHFGEGEPIRAEAIATAVQVVEKCRDLGLDAFDVFPDPTGGVLVRTYRPMEILEFYVEGPRAISFEVDVRGGQTILELQIADVDTGIERAVRAYRELKWRTRDLCTSSTGTQMTGALSAQRFSRPLVTRGSAWSSSTAAGAKLSGYVTI